MSQTVGLLYRMRNDCFLVFKWHHDLNRSISEDDVQLLDAVMDDNRLNKSLKSGLLTRLKNKWALQVEKTPKNCMQTMLHFQNTVQALHAAMKHFLNALLQLAWVFMPCIIAAEHLLLLLQSKYKQRKEVDFNRLLRCDLVFIKVQTRAVVLLPASQRRGPVGWADAGLRSLTWCV